jgi:hypothetical protein
MADFFLALWKVRRPILVAVVVAFAIVSIGTPELPTTISGISQESISIVLGVVIAAAGIQFGAIGSIYSFFSRQLAQSKPAEKDGQALRRSLAALDGTFSELRENTLFLLGAYAFTRGIILFRSIDIPLIVWPIQHVLFSRSAILSTLELTGVILGFWVTIDSINAMFIIMQIYRRASYDSVT